MRTFCLYFLILLSINNFGQKVVSLGGIYGDNKEPLHIDFDRNNELDVTFSAIINSYKPPGDEGFRIYKQQLFVQAKNGFELVLKEGGSINYTDYLDTIHLDKSQFTEEIVRYGFSDYGSRWSSPKIYGDHTYYITFKKDISEDSTVVGQVKISAPNEFYTPILYSYSCDTITSDTLISAKSYGEYFDFIKLKQNTDEKINVTILNPERTANYRSSPLYLLPANTLINDLDTNELTPLLRFNPNNFNLDSEKRFSFDKIYFDSKNDLISSGSSYKLFAFWNHDSLNYISTSNNRSIHLVGNKANLELDSSYLLPDYSYNIKYHYTLPSNDSTLEGVYMVYSIDSAISNPELLESYTNYLQTKNLNEINSNEILLFDGSTVPKHSNLYLNLISKPNTDLGFDKYYLNSSSTLLSSLLTDSIHSTFNTTCKDGDSYFNLELLNLNPNIDSLKLYFEKFQSPFSKINNGNFLTIPVSSDTVSLNLSSITDINQQRLSPNSHYKVYLQAHKILNKYDSTLSFEIGDLVLDSNHQFNIYAGVKNNTVINTQKINYCIPFRGQDVFTLEIDNKNAFEFRLTHSVSQASSSKRITIKGLNGYQFTYKGNYVQSYDRYTASNPNEDFTQDEKIVFSSYDSHIPLGPSSYLPLQREFMQIRKDSSYGFIKVSEVNVNGGICLTLDTISFGGSINNDIKLDDYLCPNSIKNNDPIVLYPNPSIHQENIILHQSKNLYNQYTIYNSIGRIIYEGYLSQNKTTNIPTNIFPQSGLYWIKTSNSNEQEVNSIVILK